jgi:hypothetical protein
VGNRPTQSQVPVPRHSFHLDLWSLLATALTCRWRSSVDCLQPLYIPIINDCFSFLTLCAACNPALGPKHREVSRGATEEGMGWRTHTQVALPRRCRIFLASRRMVVTPSHAWLSRDSSRCMDRTYRDRAGGGIELHGKSSTSKPFAKSGNNE